jgi:hypothetical protein
MAAVLSISLWIALATVVPGLVTIAVLYGVVLIIDPSLMQAALPGIDKLGEWALSGAAITIMILTQALGILLEGLLIRRKWLGPDTCEITIPRGVDPCGLLSFTLEPYAEYHGLYLLLAELWDTEDAHGHLQRALAQFFLTINTMISFAAGIVAIPLIMWHGQWNNLLPGIVCVGAIAACLLVSYRVACIRFEVMAKALWAARRRRLHREKTPTAQPVTG